MIENLQQFTYDELKKSYPPQRAVRNHPYNFCKKKRQSMVNIPLRQRVGRHSTYNFLPKLIYRPPMLNLNPSQNRKILTCPKNVRHKICLEIVFHFDYLVKCWFPLERYSTKDISFASLSQCIHSSVNFLSIQHGGHLSVLCQYFGSDNLQY